MNIFKINKVNKVIDNLHQMLDKAINGEDIESTFDETKISSLENKLHQYLSMNKLKKVKLEEEKNTINTLISDISHQTKTPISNIVLYSELLAESDLKEEDRKCVDMLVYQAEKLNFLIDSLFKASRLEAGIITIFPKNQDLNNMIEQALLQIEPKVVDKNIKINYEKTNVKAIFDLKWTIEAIYNILDNAVKYSHEGSEISIKVTSFNMFCKIDITDTGIGIKEEDLSKIFMRFYRVREVSDFDGVGVGLYLAREIILQDGGYIKVKSKVKVGSTFSVFLPLEI